MELSDLPLEIFEKIINCTQDARNHLNLAITSKSLNHLCSLVNLYMDVSYEQIKNVTNKHTFKEITITKRCSNIDIDSISPISLHIMHVTYGTALYGKTFLKIPSSVLILTGLNARIEFGDEKNYKISEIKLCNTHILGTFPKSLKRLTIDSPMHDIEPAELENVEYLMVSINGGRLMIGNGLPSIILDAENMIENMPKLIHLSLDIHELSFNIAQLVTKYVITIPNKENIKILEIRISECPINAVLDFGNNKNLEVLKLYTDEKIEIINPPTNLREYSLINPYDVCCWNQSLNLSAKKVSISQFGAEEYTCDDRVEEIILQGGTTAILSGNVKKFAADCDKFEISGTKNLEVLYVHTAKYAKINLEKLKKIRVHSQLVELTGKPSELEEVVIRSKKIVGNLLGTKIKIIYINSDADITEFFYDGKIKLLSNR